MKVITAIGNPELNNKLQKVEEIEVIGKDIQYQDGILELLESNKNIDILIISEIISGNSGILELINNIKNINNKIKILIILEKENEQLKNNLIDIGIVNILYNNKTEINEIINLIKNENINNEEEIKNEIKLLKQIILENNIKSNLNQKEKTNKIFNIKNIVNKEIKNSKIITILGTGGVGKSIISVNLANIFKLSKNKILIIDFDVLNNSIHTILGVNKHSKKAKDKIKNNLINGIKLTDLINKINKKIYIIS